MLEAELAVAELTPLWRGSLARTGNELRCGRFEALLKDAWPSLDECERRRELPMFNCSSGSDLRALAALDFEPLCCLSASADVLVLG
mmetsp:Transcript_745/g.1453  ORF Transcript_745/g.1453 Transcript_745/m.1453 type:complete len:87 (+) Transcript_745:81-341(+)